MSPSLETVETSNGEAKHVTQGHVYEEDGIVFALNLITSVMLPLTVRSAIELGIFDILAKTGKDAKLSADDIAVKIGSKNVEAPAMLDRLLRLLASHSMLHCSLSEEKQGLGSPQKLYSLAPASKYFVTDADGVSLGATLKLPLDKVFLESCTEMKGAILEGGIPFNRVYGMHAFEYPTVDPRFNDVFNSSMVNCTTIIMKRILEIYDGFENINKLVDVGGGLGINLKLITSKYPHIQGVNFDLPHVLEHAPTYEGVTHVGGDMFESVPNGDAIFLKWILHDWSDEHCLKLLKNCHKAIPDNGKVIVVELIIPVFPESTTVAKMGFQSDLLMMAQNPGGKERTEDEFKELALRSGFSEIKIACYFSGVWVLELIK